MAKVKPLQVKQVTHEEMQKEIASKAIHRVKDVSKPEPELMVNEYERTQDPETGAIHKVLKSSAKVERAKADELKKGPIPAELRGNYFDPSREKDVDTEETDTDVIDDTEEETIDPFDIDTADGGEPTGDGEDEGEETETNEPAPASDVVEDPTPADSEFVPDNADGGPTEETKEPKTNKKPKNKKPSKKGNQRKKG